MSAPGGAQEVVDRFHRLYYEAHARTWTATYWLGVQTYKCPLDLWVYQELLHELRPDVVVESGTAHGGSALFLATVCDALGAGTVVSIDVERNDRRPVHPRVRYLLGSSTAPEVVGRVTALIRPGHTVIVILDSDHHKDHVLAELRAYAPLVSPGSYLIVEDTNVNGHPVFADFGPGPMEAVDQFLGEHREFERDREREKFFLIFNPAGYLRKRKGAAA